MFFIGWVVSLFFVPVLGDTYGRKWLFVIGMWMTVFTYLGVLITHSINTVTVLMFFYGVANGMRNSLGYVYMLEFVCDRHQSAVGSLELVLESFVVLFGSIYFQFMSKNWIYMNYVGFAFVVAASIASIWCIPESPKFLMMQCRFTEARIILD
jgi:MFS family permease